MTNWACNNKGDTPGVRVVIVDGDPLARTGLAMILEAAGDVVVVGETGDEDKAVPLVQMHQPDVVLIDLQTRGLDGLAIVAAMRTLPKAPEVVALTVVDGEEEDLLAAIDAGVRGFLSKAAEPPEMVDTVHVVAAGGAVLAPDSAMTLINRFVASRACPRHHRARARLATLSDREREVVAAVAQGKPNAEIAAELYLSEATVKTHITRSFAKLDAANRVQLTIFAYESGLAGGRRVCRGPPQRSRCPEASLGHHPARLGAHTRGPHTTSRSRARLIPT